MDTADRILDEILAVMSGDAAQRIADALTYSSYRDHRQRLSAAQCAAFPDSAAMEQRYQDAINAYADSKIRADKEARHTGRAEHDLDTFGRPLPEGA